MVVKDILAELAQHPDGTFLNVMDFNDSAIGACSITGESPVWEMHPDTDEFFHVLDGELQLTLLENSGAKRYQVPAGSVFVVPQGIWHKPAAPNGVKFVYFTPGTSLHSDADDPRQTPSEQSQTLR